MHVADANLQKVFDIRFSHFISLMIVSILFAFSACSDNSSGPENENEPGPNEVWMTAQSFTPSEIEVEAGTEITWINQSNLVHTVTSGIPGNEDGMFNSGNVAPGEEYSYTFDEPGTYAYFCIPHQPAMTGTVIVTED